MEIAYENNSELEAYRLKAEESKALIKTAFNIDKTSLYYSYDENNIASNDYPIGVIGGEQRFDFPSVYFARKKANTLAYDMTMNLYEGKRKQLTRKVSKAYYQLIFAQNRHRVYAQVDSIYSRVSLAAKNRHDTGDLSYLEMLNAQSTHQEVHLALSQMQCDIEIAYANLKTLMNYDSAFVVPSDLPDLLIVELDGVESDPGYRYWQNTTTMQGEELKLEKNMLLPDLSLGYFNGTNQYAGSEHYQGFEVGLGIPLFFGEQRAKVNAKKYAMEASSSLQHHYASQYHSKLAELQAGLKKYEDAIRQYDETGKALSTELFRSSRLSYQAGEIDFFRFALSVDRAVQIQIDHLENVFKYNELVLEINYLTLEN